MLAVSAPRVLLDGLLGGPACVVIDGGRIVEVVDAAPSGAEHVRLADGFLTAGMVDLQVNGFAGVDFFEATPSEWEQAALAVAATGVTSFVATYVTHSTDDLVRGLERARDVLSRGVTPGAARLLGVHLEGPFLSPQRAGAHDARLMVAPAVSELEPILAAADVVRLVTLAPELPGSIEAIRRLVDGGIVVSLGHSAASGQQTRAAIDAGATLVTHLFNAQGPLHHREVGLPGVALDDQRLTVGVIADLEHVSAEMLRLVFRVAGPRIVLVTDAIDATGMGAGRYLLGGRDVVVDAAGVARLAADPAVLAGSTLRLGDAVRHVHGLGVDLAMTLGAATHVPADSLGRPDLGRLAVGARADLVWWSDDLEVRRVWIDGSVRTPSG